MQNQPPNPDNNEKNDVEATLQQLGAGQSGQLKGLALFSGGAHLFVLGEVLKQEAEVVTSLAGTLIDTGLASAEGIEEGHLTFGPALAAWCADLQPASVELETRWLEGMTNLTEYLLQQHPHDPELTNRLTQLELPNLLGMLERIEARLENRMAGPDKLEDLAVKVERLLTDLDRPEAMEQVIAFREEALRRLKESGRGWNGAQFEKEREQVEKLLAGGQVQAAYEAADALLKRAQRAGEEAYTGAGYDLAGAYFWLGRVKRLGGAPEEALEQFFESRKRFQQLADGGDRRAERMASAALTEIGDCHLAQGAPEEAAQAYQDGIERAMELDDPRGIATRTFQLGTARMNQKRFDEALGLYNEARGLFSNLDEPAGVGAVWRQIATLHRMAERYGEAEQALQEALTVWRDHEFRADEANSLNELGNLYGITGRVEEAITMFREAADMARELKEPQEEIRRRNNLAGFLIGQERMEEARSELQRSLECGKPFGHAAQPWKVWTALYELEQACSNEEAANEARGQAITCYQAYRRDGGENPTPGGRLCAMVAHALSRQETDGIGKLLEQGAAKSEADSHLNRLIAKLQAILEGDQTPSLADDPALRVDDAAELELLLDNLNKVEQT